MIVRESLAATIKRLRSQSGMSQEEVAHRAGLSHRTIGDIECSVRRRPRRNTIQAIADAMQLDSAHRSALYRAASQDGLALPPPRELIGRERELGDLAAAFASPGAFVYYAAVYSGGWSGEEGTSWASPASVALLVEADELHSTKLGQVDPSIYSLFKSTGYSDYFTPCTSGNNINYTCSATQYNQAAGIGAPKGWALANAL